MRAHRLSYHGWTYELNGTLRAAPQMQRTRDFERGHYGLVPLRVETWQGFMFVSFDPDIAPLASYYGDLLERFSSYRFDEMVLTRRSHYELSCNWKLLIENAHEAYTYRSSALRLDWRAACGRARDARQLGGAFPPSRDLGGGPAG